MLVHLFPIIKVGYLYIMQIISIVDFLEENNNREHNLNNLKTRCKMQGLTVELKNTCLCVSVILYIINDGIKRECKFLPLKC